jgi:nucleotide-binding universal stress UspA family protein
MKTILYATDYSQNSEAALKYAYSLCKTLNTKLIVVHVFDYPTLLDDFSLKGEAPFPDIERDALSTHLSKLEQFCTKVLKSDLEKLNLEVEAIEHKSVVDGIIEKVIATNAFLLLTGMKGGSHFREVIMGNTTRHLIDKSPCPVLTIPADVSHRKIETVVYATDFEKDDINDILFIAEIAEVFGANIKIIHISPLKEFDRNKLMTDFEKKVREKTMYPNIEFDIIPSDNTFEELRLYLGKVNADIIAMLERKSNDLFKKIFHRDLVKKMEFYGKIPLLSFKEKITKK